VRIKTSFILLFAALTLACCMKCLKDVPHEKLDSPLVPIEQVEAEYPKEAIEAGIEGTVTVRAWVRPNGEVGMVSVKTNSGNELLKEAAIEAAREWRFSTPRKNGKEVFSTVEIPFHFELD